MLFIAFEGAPRGLDPVRLQKGMFLFAQETDVPARQKYEFRAYNYGPMSPDIYSDIDKLVASGLVEPVAVEGQSWSRYRPTKTVYTTAANCSARPRRSTASPPDTCTRRSTLSPR